MSLQKPHYIQLDIDGEFTNHTQVTIGIAWPLIKLKLNITLGLK